MTKEERERMLKANTVVETFVGKIRVRAITGGSMYINDLADVIESLMRLIELKKDR